MLTKTQKQILAYLVSNPEEHHTIRGITRKLKKSYALAYNNIKELERKNIIIKKSAPPASIISLNEFMPAEVFLEIELERKKEFLKKHPWMQIMLDDILKSTSNIFFILLVFGSYAKGTETGKSDLDLLFILKEKKDIREMEKNADKIYTKIKKSINFADVEDFLEMARNTNKLNVINEARKYHIILYGVEQYYQLLSNL